MIGRLLPILILFFYCSTLYAQEKHVLPASGNQRGRNGITISESSQKRLKMKANIGAISLSDTTTKKGDFLELQTDGTYSSGAEGEPQLPAFRKLVQIPVGAKPIVNIKHADTTFYTLSDFNIKTKLSPRQPSLSKSGDKPKFKYRKRSYRHNYFTQNELVTINQIGSMRGVGIGQVNVNPVRYNPKQNTLMVFSNIEFDIEFEGGTAKASAKDGSPYFDGVYSALGNYKSGNSNTSNKPVKYLIVTDTAFLGALADFIKWKQQKGFNVVVATTDTLGNFANDIKEWVSTQYHSATDDDPAPSFLLLAADTDKIPASRTGASTGYGTDLYYACMDGDGDIIPDIFYGRFSARTAAQMKAIADKTIAYEKYMFEDPSYLAKATLIAGYDGTYRSAVGIPTVNYIANNRVNAKNGYNTVNKFTTSYSGCYSNESVSVGLMTYTAHGEVSNWVDPQLTKTKVNSFGNSGKFPFVVANCCLSGQFTSDECLGETWLRKENGGAVAYIGSSPKTYWDEDFYWAVGAHKRQSGVSPDTSATTTGAFDAPFVSDFLCGAAIMYAGNMAVTEARDSNNYSGTVSSRYYWEGYNYLGDPSLLVYFGEAKNNIVSHNPTIPVSSNTITVNALSNSYIAISHDGELLGAAYVPAGESSVSVPINPIGVPCEIDVVVTKPRYKPYFGKITAILPDKSYLAIIDNPFKNKSIQYGGTANFDVTVNNFGQQASQNATMSITSTSPFVKNVSASQPTLSPIGSMASCTIAGLCHIELIDNIADGTKIPLKFTISEDGQTTNSEFTLNVTAPKLNLETKATIDKPNGQIFPGETADIIIPITNTGHERIDLATVKLTADDEHPMVQIISNNQTISNLNPGDTIICRFTIATNEFADMMTPFDFKVTATANEPLHSDSCRYTITIGKLEDKIIGTGTSTEDLYPFNNYYKTGRTQILYTADDIGNKPIMIDEIAFSFYYTTPQNKFNGFSNFTLKMKYYNSDNLELRDFVDVSDAETVLKMDLMNIDSKELNLKFDKPFVYDGKHNVLLEIGWGQNTDYVDKNYRPDIYCHTTKKVSVASEFDDNAESPDEITTVYRRSTTRPNTIFRYQKPKYLFFDVTDTNGEPLAGIDISVDNSSAITDNNGCAQLYTFTNRAIEYTLNSIDYAVVKEAMSRSNDTVRIALQLIRLNVFAVTFHVVDSATRASLPNARISIGKLTATTNNLGIATFDNIPNRPLEYTVEADNYFGITEAFSTNSDTLFSVGIAQKPWITFNIHNDSIPQANIGISISNSVISTDNTGMVTHVPQRFDTILYSIVINKITITDTIFNLRKPTAVDINLALIDTVAPTPPQHGDSVPQLQTHTIVFCLSDGSTPIDSVLIKVNDIEKNTDSTGCAMFDSLAAGATITYTICKDGYETTDGHKLLTDSIICSENSVIRVTLKKQANPSLIAEYQSDIKIYPNPSDGVFTIQNTDGVKISLFNIDGKLVKTTKITNSTIDLRPIASGLYTLIIETPNGNVATQIVIR